MLVKSFFESDYVYFANNKNFQSIASYIDGLRPTARKVFYTYKEYVKNKSVKVAQLANMTAEKTQYLGDETGISGVIVNNTKDFIFKNNIPMLLGEGHFGNRFYPNSSAAPRYIFVKANPEYFKLYNSDDNPILIHQEFENEPIEPRFYLPVIPTILINGSEGIGNGFSQRILPRDPKLLKEIILNRLVSNTLPEEIKPYFKGFKGSVDRENLKTTITGILDITTKGRSKTLDIITITELPNYSLQEYIKKLERLQDKKIIENFEDKSDDDKFYFEITVKKSHDKEYWIDKLSLSTTVTENFTCIDENNSIIQFKNEIELLEKFIDIKLKYIEKRRLNKLKTLEAKLDFIKDRVKFISVILNKSLKVFKRSRDKILTDAQSIGILYADKHLRIGLDSFTSEKLKELEKEYESISKEVEKLKSTTAKDIWIEELKDLELKEV